MPSRISATNCLAIVSCRKAFRGFLAIQPI
jgi:hypothetical protein